MGLEAGLLDEVRRADLTAELTAVEQRARNDPEIPRHGESGLGRAGPRAYTRAVTEIPLKYGCNPNQRRARVVLPDGSPLRVRNGAPSYINVLDALRGWQLVRELRAATGRASAASYKHVSPAGAAVDGPIDEAFCSAFFYDLPPSAFSPIAAAYARARSSDRVASFGDFIAVSEPVDEALAQLVKPEVSDGIIAAPRARAPRRRACGRSRKPGDRHATRA